MSSIDKKPKFEPDPPPDFTGLSFDDAFAEYKRWTQAQHDRMADWWPRETESRLDRIEQFVPLVGTWPIVDYSYILVTLSEAIVVNPCDVTSYTVESAVYGDATDFEIRQIGEALAVSPDQDSMVVGKQEGQYVNVYLRNGSSWSRQTVITHPSGITGFGRGLDFNENIGILVIGADLVDVGGTGQAGAFCIYQGSNQSGWSFLRTTVNPFPTQDAGLGQGVEFSADGQVLAVAATGGVGWVGLWDFDGDDDFVYRTRINDPGGVSDTGFGRAIEFSPDKSVLAIGHPGYGVGSQGRVYIYDDVGGTYTLRQAIDRPDTTENGIPGFPSAANRWFFGRSARFSSDLKYLFITVPNWKVGSVIGGFWVFVLNSDTNEYEYCQYYLTGGVAEPIEVFWDGSNAKVYVGGTTFQNPADPATEQGGVKELQAVIS